MQHVGTTIAIILGIALLFAIGVLVFGVGKFMCGIAHHCLRECKPKRQFHHAKFGVFNSDGDLWTCKFHHEGRELQFVIGGTKDAPSERLVAQAQSILERFAAVEQRASAFLRSRETEVRAAVLDFWSLEITDEQRPDDFTFEFLEPRDDSRTWRVEFAAGEPKHTGFDD